MEPIRGNLSYVLLGNSIVSADVIPQAVMNPLNRSITLLKSGIDSWNQWRAKHPDEPCTLAGQDLSHGYFFEGNFRQVNLKGANLRRACLIGADLSGADLSGADLSGAYLGDANLYGANLSYADLSEANLDRADLRRANLMGTQMVDADFRTAQLPDPDVDPYADAVLNLLAQHNLASGSISNSSSQKQSKKTTRRAAMRSRWLQSIQLPPLTRESQSSAAIRQQAIRQSALPLPSKTATQSLPRAITAPLASASVASPYAKSQRAASQSANPSWGTRQASIQLSVQLKIARRAVWMPAVAAGLLLAIGLPLSMANLNSQRVAAQASAPFALVKSLTGTGQVWTVATHAQSGSSWVIGGGAKGQIEIWNGQTGEIVRTLSGHRAGVRTLAIANSGKWLVSGGSDGLKVWQPETGALVYSVAASSEVGNLSALSEVRSVAISPDERTIVSSDRAGNITAWRLDSGEQLYSIDNGASVGSVAIAPDGKSFVSGSSDHAVRQWDLASGQLLREFSGHSDAVNSIAISPDGKTLASGSWDKTIKLWDLATGDLQTTLSGHRDRVLSLAISPDSKILASGSLDSTLKLWDLPSRQLSETLDKRSDSIVAVAFDPTESTLVSAGQDQSVKLWQ